MSTPLTLHVKMITNYRRNWKQPIHLKQPSPSSHAKWRGTRSKAIWRLDFPSGRPVQILPWPFHAYISLLLSISATIRRKEKHNSDGCAFVLPVVDKQVPQSCR